MPVGFPPPEADGEAITPSNGAACVFWGDSVPLGVREGVGVSHGLNLRTTSSASLTCRSAANWELNTCRTIPSRSIT